MNRAVVWIYRRWKGLLAVLGITTLSDLVKDYLRVKMMEWAVSNLGSIGRWLVANPFSLLTIAVVVILAGLLAVMILQSTPSESPIVDQTGQRFVRTKVSIRWKLACALVIVALGCVAIAYGQRSYRARGRAVLTIADVELRTDPQKTEGKFTVVNEGKSILFPGSVIQSDVVVAPHYSSAEEENNLFKGGSRWDHNSLPVALDFADTVTLSFVKPGFPAEELKRLKQQNMVIYLILEIYGKDEVGPLPQSQGCWYISPDDWNRATKCSGHNSFETPSGN